MGQLTGSFGNTSLLGTALAMAVSIVGADSAFAQSIGRCSQQQTVSSQRQTLNCEAGLSIVVERGARYQLVDRNADGHLDAIKLNGKAVLVDVDSNRFRGGFEVVTPQAIAAVRGTRWAVDADRAKTSVLVLRGRVAVNRASGGPGVRLGPGQGVDVDNGRTQLQVTRWKQPRVDALMARLGQ